MKILLAVDMSDDSDAAAKAVAAQFSPKENEVKVVYAANWEAQLPTSFSFAEGPSSGHAVVSFEEQVLHEADDYVNRVASSLRQSGFSASTLVAPEGTPHTVILDAATRWPADLIVMGSHGRKGMGRFLLGSVAEDIMRHARCAVQIVRPARVPLESSK